MMKTKYEVSIVTLIDDKNRPEKTIGFQKFWALLNFRHKQFQTYLSADKSLSEIIK